MGAGVAEQIGEESVRAERVIDGRRRGEPTVPLGELVPPRRVLPTQRRDVLGAELLNGVAPRVRATAVAEPAEPVDHAEPVQHDQAVLGGVEVRK